MKLKPRWLDCVVGEVIICGIYSNMFYARFIQRFDTRNKSINFALVNCQQNNLFCDSRVDKVPFVVYISIIRVYEMSEMTSSVINPSELLVTGQIIFITYYLLTLFVCTSGSCKKDSLTARGEATFYLFFL